LPTHLVAHLHFLPTQKPSKKMQKSHQAKRTKTLQTMDNKVTTDITPAGNSGLAKVAVQCSADTFVVNQSLVLRINICGKIATFAKPQNDVAKFATLFRHIGPAASTA